ncbi:MAG TPA: DegT/DnrJ/EryC1/StrS family aminotransferase [Solirubrobacterales bacterium]|jgi:dTDP-4-amino-4,6-dideoxygalactose transaminase
MFPGGLEISVEEREAVCRVLDSRRLIRFYGPDDPDGEGCASEVDEFEHEFAARIGTAHALGVTSGTAALIVGLAALGVGPGDEVIIPAYTFIASAAAVLAVGALPVIAEIDESLTLDPARVLEAITPHTRAIMPVHMRGMPARMDELREIAAERDLRLIEDVAQATGASYRSHPLGSLGDIGAFSLQMHKIITTGEGGILTADDPDLLFRAKCFHDSANEWRGAAWQHPDPAVRATFVAFPGMNFRMAEITGAIGRVQLGRLDGLLERMRRHKAVMRGALAETGRVALRDITDPGEAATALVFFTADPERAGQVSAGLLAEGIPARVLYVRGEHDWHVYACWRDVLAQRTWNRQGYPFSTARREIRYHPDLCPRSLELLSRAVHIDIPPQMTQADVERVTAALQEVVRALC